jgi:hypothetical protein
MPLLPVPRLIGVKPSQSNDPPALTVESHSLHAEKNSGNCKHRQGKKLRYTAVMGCARPARSGFFPLDEQLGLVPGTLTPRSQDHLTHLATWMPFERATQMLKALTGVQISEATARRNAYRVGEALVAVQQAQAMGPVAPPLPHQAKGNTSSALMEPWFPYFMDNGLK